MPWLFVLIWSTGFVVARLAMPHSPPFGFLPSASPCRWSASSVWIALAGAAWPQGRAQWVHLAVTGVLMQAGYLGGVWAAVKARARRRHGRAARRPAAGADGALAVAQRRRRGGASGGRGAPVARPGARLRRPRPRRLGQARRGEVTPAEPGDGGRRAVRHHHRHALPEALRRALRRAHGERRADARRARRLPAARAARARADGLASRPRRSRWRGRSASSRSAAARCCTCSSSAARRPP